MKVLPGKNRSDQTERKNMSGVRWGEVRWAAELIWSDCWLSTRQSPKLQASAAVCRLWDSILCCCCCYFFWFNFSSNSRELLLEKVQLLLKKNPRSQIMGAVKKGLDRCQRRLQSEFWRLKANVDVSRKWIKQEGQKKASVWDKTESQLQRLTNGLSFVMIDLSSNRQKIGAKSCFQRETNKSISHSGYFFNAIILQMCIFKPLKFKLWAKGSDEH